MLVTSPFCSNCLQLSLHSKFTDSYDFVGNLPFYQSSIRVWWQWPVDLWKKPIVVPCEKSPHEKNMSSDTGRIRNLEWTWQNGKNIIVSLDILDNEYHIDSYSISWWIITIPSENPIILFYIFSTICWGSRFMIDQQPVTIINYQWQLIWP